MPKHDEPDLRPFYAVAGLADVIADLFRESVAARQRKAEERLAEIRDRRLERVEQARVNADELREFLSTLPEQVRALPDTTRIRLADLQRQAEELVAQAGDTPAPSPGAASASWTTASATCGRPPAPRVRPPRRTSTRRPRPSSRWSTRRRRP